MSILKVLGLISILLFAFTNVLGQTDSNITIWGYVDAYYAYNFNQPPSRIIGEMMNGNSHIYSHNRHNEFNVNNAILGIKYNNDKVRGAFALHSGTYVSANYAAEPDVFKNIFEANAGYQLGKNTWIDAGIFASHIGFESAISFDCQTLTRSMLADNTPYFETGVKITHQEGEKLTLTGLVLNGWQNIIDHNKNKALGTQIQYKPTDRVLINWSTFYGKEAGAYELTSGILNTDSLSTRRFFNNFYIQANLNDKLSVTADFDIGIQKERLGTGNYIWYSPDLILRYAFSDKIALAARAEYYSDEHGVIIYSGTPHGFQTFSSSMNFDLKMTEKIMWRIEGRVFSSKDNVYINNNKASNQSTLVVSSLAIKW